MRVSYKGMDSDYPYRAAEIYYNEEALKRIKEKNPTAFFEIDGYINHGL